MKYITAPIGWPMFWLIITIQATVSAIAEADKYMVIMLAICAAMFGAHLAVLSRRLFNIWRAGHKDLSGPEWWEKE